MIKRKIIRIPLILFDEKNRRIQNSKIMLERLGTKNFSFPAIGSGGED